MKCYLHEDKDSVATCQTCGLALCSTCAMKYKPCMCEGCAGDITNKEKEQVEESKEQQLAAAKQELTSALLKGVASGVVASVVILLLGERNVALVILMAFVFFFLPFGWAALTRIQNVIMHGFFMPLPALAIFLVFKLFASIFLGMPLFAYLILKYILQVIAIKKFHN